MLSRSYRVWQSCSHSSNNSTDYRFQLSRKEPIYLYVPLVECYSNSTIRMLESNDFSEKYFKHYNKMSSGSTPTSSTPLTPATAPANAPGIGEDIYSGAASFGLVWALIGAIIATIIGIIMIGFGIYILRLPTQTSVKGTILSINGNPTGICPSTTQGNNTTYNCYILVQYNFQGKDYTKQLRYSGSTGYSIGSTINVCFKSPNNPDDVTLDCNPSKSLGWVLIGIAIATILGGWFWYWASRKWKFIAAAEGVSGAFDLISGGRRW